MTEENSLRSELWTFVILIDDPTSLLTWDQQLRLQAWAFASQEVAFVQTRLPS